MKLSDIERQAWDRQLHESSKSYYHFTLYRDMGIERSLRKLASDAKCTSKLRQLMRWSSRYNWWDRAAEYDGYLDRLGRFEQEKSRRKMLDRHANIAILGQSAVVTTLERTVKDLSDDPQKKLNLQDAARLLDIAVKVERLSRGEPSEITELGTAPGRPIQVTAEQRAREAIEVVLGLSGGLVERVEEPAALTEGETGPGEAASVPDLSAPFDPFANLPTSTPVEPAASESPPEKP